MSHQSGKNESGARVSPFLGEAPPSRIGAALGAVISLLTVAWPASADDPPAAAFARAEEHFAAKRLRDAADGFRAIAVGSPDPEIGGRAAMRYLDAEVAIINSGSEPSSTLRVTNQKFLELYCSPTKKPATDPKLCPLLVKVDCDLTRLEAEAKIRTFDKGGDDASDAAREAGDLYMSTWKTHGEGPIKAGRAPECGRMEEVLYNAARAYQAAKRMPQAMEARLILVAPQYKLHTTELAKKSVWEMGQWFFAIGEFDQAASWLDRFARESPASSHAPDALNDVIILRMALGQMDGAEEATNRFVKSYGSKLTENSARIALAIGAGHAEKGDARRAERWLKGLMGVINRGPLDIRIRATATLGQVLAAQKDEKGAEKHYTSVVSVFRDPEVVRRLATGEAADDLRRLGQTLTALGEAHFFLAELDRKRTITEKIPAYKGPADADAVSKFLTTKTAPAIAARRRAIEEVEKKYLAILQIEPAPPPKWIIAAGGQVAQMWIDMIDEVSSLDIKGKPAKGVEFAKAVRAAMDAALDPSRQRAKAAARTCLNYAVKFQYTSPYSERCAAWLTRTYPQEFPRIEELAPAPGLLREGATSTAPAGRILAKPD